VYENFFAVQEKTKLSFLFISQKLKNKLQVKIKIKCLVIIN